jgi:hypothetical protein
MRSNNSHSGNQPPGAAYRPTIVFPRNAQRINLSPNISAARTSIAEIPSLMRSRIEGPAEAYTDVVWAEEKVDIP